MYNYLDKIFPEDKSIEILPMFYERLYFEENKSNKDLQEHINSLNKRIIESKSPEIEKYKLAKDIEEELLKYYMNGHTSLEELNSQAKKLIKFK